MGVKGFRVGSQEWGIRVCLVPNLPGSVKRETFLTNNTVFVKYAPCFDHRGESPHSCVERERELFVENLLVRLHSIMEMILVDRPCAMGN